MNSAEAPTAPSGSAVMISILPPLRSPPVLMVARTFVVVEVVVSARDGLHRVGLSWSSSPAAAALPVRSTATARATSCRSRSAVTTPIGLWGPGRRGGGTTAVAVNLSRSYLRTIFSEVVSAGVVQTPHGVWTEERGDPIWICTHRAVTWALAWPTTRHYG